MGITMTSIQATDEQEMRNLSRDGTEQSNATEVEITSYRRGFAVMVMIIVFCVLVVATVMSVVITYSHNIQQGNTKNFLIPRASKPTNATTEQVYYSWTEWSSWSSCRSNATCALSTSERERNCTWRIRSGPAIDELMNNATCGERVWKEYRRCPSNCTTQPGMDNNSNINRSGVGE